jgi:N-methylhydantoinase A
VGEFERTSTTVINAYIQPAVGRYLARLESALADVAVCAPVRVMQSSGGVMSARAAAERPVHIVESGPAAGVIAAQQLAHGFCDVRLG